MPPSASSNRPALASVAPVNAPRTWPNSSLSNRVSTIAEQLHGDELAVARGAAELVQRARDELLARAGFAGDERRAHVRRQPADRVEQLLHRRALRPIMPWNSNRLRDLAVDGQQQTAPLDAALHRRQQLAEALEVERLGQVVERAELDRFDRGVDRGVRGHQNHLAAPDRRRESP